MRKCRYQLVWIMIIVNSKHILLIINTWRLWNLRMTNVLYCLGSGAGTRENGEMTPLGISLKNVLTALTGIWYLLYVPPTSRLVSRIVKDNLMYVEAFYNKHIQDKAIMLMIHVHCHEIPIFIPRIFCYTKGGLWYKKNPNKQCNVVVEYVSAYFGYL